MIDFSNILCEKFPPTKKYCITVYLDGIMDEEHERVVYLSEESCEKLKRLMESPNE